MADQGGIGRVEHWQDPKADPDSALIHEVVATGEGTSLALAPIYLAAARKLGLTMHACNCSLLFQPPVGFFLVSHPLFPFICHASHLSNLQTTAATRAYCCCGQSPLACLTGLVVPAALPQMSAPAEQHTFACCPTHLPSRTLLSAAQNTAL